MWIFWDNKAGWVRYLGHYLFLLHNLRHRGVSYPRPEFQTILYEPQWKAWRAAKLIKRRRRGSPLVCMRPQRPQGRQTRERVRPLGFSLIPGNNINNMPSAPNFHNCFRAIVVEEPIRTELIQKGSVPFWKALRVWLVMMLPKVVCIESDNSLGHWYYTE